MLVGNTRKKNHSPDSEPLNDATFKERHIYTLKRQAFCISTVAFLLHERPQKMSNRELGDAANNMLSRHIDGFLSTNPLNGNVAAGSPCTVIAPAMHHCFALQQYCMCSCCLTILLVYCLGCLAISCAFCTW